jgi:hypothetical protein
MSRSSSRRCDSWIDCIEVKLSPWVFSSVHRTMASSTMRGRRILATCRIRWYRSLTLRGMSLSSLHPPRERSMSVPSPSDCSSIPAGLIRRLKENSVPDGVKCRGCLRRSMIRRCCEGCWLMNDSDLYSRIIVNGTKIAKEIGVSPVCLPWQADDLSICTRFR